MDGWIVRGLRLSTGRGGRVVCRRMPWGDREVGVHSTGNWDREASQMGGKRFGDWHLPGQLLGFPAPRGTDKVSGDEMSWIRLEFPLV